LDLSRAEIIMHTPKLDAYNLVVYM